MHFLVNLLLNLNFGNYQKNKIPEKRKPFLGQNPEASGQRVHFESIQLSKTERPTKPGLGDSSAAMAEAVTGGTEVPPNMTIYINNLNEKIKLDGTCY